MDETIERYSNSMQMRGSAFDVVIEFSVDTPVGEIKPGQIPPIERSQVTLIRTSWAHLKSMIPVMMEQINAIEAQLGPIPLPAELQQRFDKAMRSGRP